MAARQVFGGDGMKPERQLVWGSYKGHLQHLFRGTECVQSECGAAYCGDEGLTSPSKRKKCSKCLEIERIANEPSKTLHDNHRRNPPLSH